MHRNKSASSHQFAMVPRADIPRSSFKMQKTLKTTFDAGYLVPILCEEVLPGDGRAEVVRSDGDSDGDDTCTWRLFFFFSQSPGVGIGRSSWASRRILRIRFRTRFRRVCLLPVVLLSGACRICSGCRRLDRLRALVRCRTARCRCVLTT